MKENEKNRNNRKNETATAALDASTGGALLSGGGRSPSFFAPTAQNCEAPRACDASASPLSLGGATFPPFSNRGLESGKNSAPAPSRPKNSVDSTVFVSNVDGGSAVSLTGFWSSDFLDQLADFKLTLQNSNVQKSLIGRFNEFDVVLYQNGKSAAGGGFPAAFILDYLLPDGLAFKVYLSRCSTPGIPNVYIQFHYSMFRRWNFFDSVQIVREVLESAGYSLERLSISRLDVNVTANIPMSYFTDAIAAGRVLFSARKMRVYQNRGRVETIETGTRGETLVLRVYDKISELQAKYDPLKVEDLQKQFRDFSEVTRFEFEICRDVLRKFEIVDENDLVENLATLLDWATRKAFRIEVSDRRGKDRHSNRIVLDSTFEKIRRAFLAFAEKLNPCVLSADVVSYVRLTKVEARMKTIKVVRRLRKKSVSLLKAGVSTVTTALSRLSTRPLEKEKLLRLLFDVFFKGHEKIYIRYRGKYANVG